MSEAKKMNLYIIKFKKNGVAKEYQIPASTEYNAAVRLGQIYGDNHNYREDLEIEIVDIKKVS